ncbi:MAG: T9SS type A sorting domain-containing protein [Paludibacter sp.]|nr:T9SS type A sorting domain-containing protein [Paludibacter sp.]
MKTKLFFIVTFIFTLSLLKAQTPFIMYDDIAQGYSASFNSWPTTNFWANCDAPAGVQYSGANCIEWDPAVSGTNIWEEFYIMWWDGSRNGGIDLSSYANAGDVLQFYFKSSSTVGLDPYYVKFVDYTPTAGQFVAKAFLTNAQLVCDGTWHQVNIPLSTFLQNSDAGFTWEYINTMRFTKEDATPVFGQSFFFDQISLTTATTGLENNKANNKLSVYILSNEAQINMGDIAGKVVIYNMNGQTVKNIGYLEANTKLLWNKKGDNGNTLPVGIYMCKIQGTKEVSKIMLR